MQSDLSRLCDKIENCGADSCVGLESHSGYFFRVKAKWGMRRRLKEAGFKWHAGARVWEKRVADLRHLGVFFS